VEPGFFRTDFLDEASAQYGSHHVEDYAEASAQLRWAYADHNHNQAGDPAKLAQVIVSLTRHANPPLRFAAGSDAVAGVRGTIDQLQAELDAWQSLSKTTDAQAAPEMAHVVEA